MSDDAPREKENYSACKVGLRSGKRARWRMMERRMGNSERECVRWGPVCVRCSDDGDQAIEPGGPGNRTALPY